MKQVIRNLEEIGRQELIYALENDITAIVQVEDGHFVGVNVVPNGKLKILESDGPWSYGIIKE